MASQIAPNIESEVYIERPISPPSTSFGDLFAGFLKSSQAPASASAINSQADIAFGEAVQQARQIEDPSERAKVMREAALTLIGTTGEISEDQELLFRGVTGLSLDVSMGVDPAVKANEDFLASAEGQAFVRMVQEDIKAQGLTGVTDEQVQQLALSRRDEYGALQLRVSAEQNRIDAGLLGNSEVILESIAEDMNLMTTAFQKALEDGVVTEQERLSIRSQVSTFASTKYGRYRDKVDGVDETLTEMERLVTELTNFDEVEVILDQYQVYQRKQGADAVSIAAFRQAIKKGDLASLGTSLSSMMQSAETLGLIDTTINLDFMSTEELQKAADQAVDTPSDPAQAATKEQQQLAYIKGTLELNSGDMNMSDTEVQASFFNQAMGMSLIIASQDEALLPKAEREMLTDINFISNIRKFAQLDPVRGEELVTAYESALRSDLNSMDNQIASTLGPELEDVLTINDKGFGIDFNRLSEKFSGKKVAGTDLTDVVGLLEDKVKAAGGLQNYLNLSVRNQQVQAGSNGPMFTLSTLMGLSGVKDFNRVFKLSPERTKIDKTLREMTKLKETLGIIGLAEQALEVDEPSVDDNSIQSEELGALGSQDSPYSFEGMSDEEARKTFDSIPTGGFFVNPADGKLYEIVSRTEDETIFRDVETGQQFK